MFLKALVLISSILFSTASHAVVPIIIGIAAGDTSLSKVSNPKTIVLECRITESGLYICASQTQ